MTKTTKAMKDFKNNFTVVMVQSKSSGARFVAVQGDEGGLVIFGGNYCSTYTPNEAKENFEMVAHMYQPEIQQIIK